MYSLRSLRIMSRRFVICVVMNEAFNVLRTTDTNLLSYAFLRSYLKALTAVALNLDWVFCNTTTIIPDTHSKLIHIICIQTVTVIRLKHWNCELCVKYSV